MPQLGEILRTKQTLQMSLKLRLRYPTGSIFMTITLTTMDWDQMDKWLKEICYPSMINQ